MDQHQRELVDAMVKGRQDQEMTCSEIVCTACFAGVLFAIAICAYIVGSVGFYNTRLLDLEPYCPHDYWNGSFALLFLRVPVYLVSCCLMALSKWTSKQGEHACCTACIALSALLVIFSVTVSDAVITSNAISALNCSAALRANGKDDDALLIVSGSLFVVLDWMVLLSACCRALCMCRESDAVSPR
jgi:hypothetical protein